MGKNCLFTRILAITAALCVFVSQAAAQSLDESWIAYEEAADAYAEATGQLDTYEVSTTQGDRIFRRAIDASSRLLAAVDQLLTFPDALGEEDREALVDTYLTVWQVEGSLLVDVRECERASERLDALLLHPELPARPLLVERATSWRDRAHACVAEQRAAAANASAQGGRPTTGAAGGVEGPAADDLAWAQTAPPLRRSPRVPVGISLVATGGAMLVGGAAWDLALGGTRDDFRAQRDACGDDSGFNCDYDALLSTRDQLSESRVPIGLLYGVGAAAVITGAILWATGSSQEQAGPSVSTRSAPRSPLAVMPIVGPGHGGVLLRFSP